jgi:hypothetical protein
MWEVDVEVDVEVDMEVDVDAGLEGWKRFSTAGHLFM